MTDRQSRMITVKANPQPILVDLARTALLVVDMQQGLVLREVAPAWTAEEVQALNEAKLIISEDLKEIEL